MDRNSKIVLTNEYQEDLKKNKDVTQGDLDKQYIIEDGNKFRVPYRIVRMVTFRNVNREGEFRDQPHAARLQYRLMEKDSILKARVNFTKNTITIMYNPKTADNLKDKISLDEIIDFLKTQNVNVSKDAAEDKDFDYVKDFYSYAFNPPSIREHPPYGYTMEEWKKLKSTYQKKLAEGRAKSWDKFKEFQKNYETLHPEIKWDEEEQSKL